jgi:transcriptional regulator with XRE-family HTH domain
VEALKQQLGVELRGLRERAALSGSAVAAQLGWSQSKVSRVETARFGATLTEVAELVSVFDVPDDVRAELLSMAARASGVPGAWVVRAGGPPRRQAEVASVESRLAGLRQYHALVVPGLLQAPAYTRAVAVAGGFGDPDDLVERRRRRQSLVGNEGGPDCRFVIDERSLLRWPGDRAVMVDQIDHLTVASKRPAIEIRVLRVGPGATVLSVAPFIIYEYYAPDSPPVVFCEGQTADTYLSDPSDVESHSALFDRLQREALSPTASRKFLSELRRTLAA